MITIATVAAVVMTPADRLANLPLATRGGGALVFYEEGRGATVAVAQQQHRDNVFRRLYIQGVSNSGDAMASQRYMRLQALLPVHLFGQCVDWNGFARIGKEYSLALVEDAAQAWGARYDGVSVGALGEVAAFSFYPTKNLSAAGDAGMVTTNDPVLAERVRMLRQHGMRERYYHDEIGWNARMDGFQGAVFIDGQGGTNTVNVHDNGSTTPHAYIITADSLTRDGVTGSGTNIQSVNYYLGNGGNTATIAGTINGDVNLGMGNGNNTYTISAVIAGHLSVNTGSGTNNLDTGTAVVDGNVTVNFGNGADTFTFNAGSTIGGNVNVTMGTGADSVALNSTTYGGLLRVTMGGGSDTVAWAATATAGAATIDFGVGFGNDVWVPPTVFTFPLTLLNFHP